MQTIVLPTPDGGALVVAYLPPPPRRGLRLLPRPVINTTGEAVTEPRLQERPQLRLVAGELAA